LLLVHGIKKILQPPPRLWSYELWAALPIHDQQNWRI